MTQIKQGSTTIVFDGHRGTIKSAKPIINTYQRLRSNKVWSQRVGTKADSNINMWKAIAAQSEIVSTITSLNAMVGKYSEIDLDGITYENCIITDYNETYYKTAHGYILEIDLTIEQDAAATVIEVSGGP
jgi:hypothetical protein